MAKIKLTKNELKRQKDALKMYQRYLPTLQLKKQQLSRTSGRI
jgi:V/A-type H+-transporting ATPase subunit D